MSRDVRLLLPLLAVFATSCPAPATASGPTTALVTRAQGPILAATPDGRYVKVEPGRVLPGDWRLSIPAGATLSVVCSNDRRVDLGESTGSASRRVAIEVETKPVCDGGEPLLPETYRDLARGDRDLAFERSDAVRLLLLKARTRGSEEADPRIPILLDPRGPAVRAARPSLRWTRVPEAREYVVEMLGATHWRVQLPASGVPCRREPYPPGWLDVCSVPWPETEDPLSSDQPAFLSIGARTGLVTPLRSAEPRVLRLLPSGQVAKIDASLRALRDTEMPQPEEALRSALLLDSQGLHDDAAATLRSSLAENPSAIGFLLLGSLDLERGLPRSAIRCFLEAADLGARDAGLTSASEEGIVLARTLLSEAP